MIIGLQTVLFAFLFSFLFLSGILSVSYILDQSNINKYKMFLISFSQAIVCT